MSEQRPHIDAMALLVVISFCVVCVAIVLLTAHIAAMIPGDRSLAPQPPKLRPLVSAEMPLRPMTSEELEQSRLDDLERLSAWRAGMPFERRRMDRELPPDCPSG